MIYMHPKRRLIRAQINEKRAVYLVKGSLAALSICRIVKMALDMVLYKVHVLLCHRMSLS